jgi:hypothetical protein
MFGSLTRRRRPLWAWTAALLLGAVVACVYMASGARSAALEQASTDARLAAQTELATLLEPRDLIAPVVGERAVELQAAIGSQITSTSPIDDVRIYSSLGRILYAEDPTIVGTRPSYLRDATFEVASGEPMTQVRGSMLQTLVPIWLSPGGTVVVAEMSQPAGPIASSAAKPWYLLAAGCGLLMVGAIALVVASSRPQAPASVPAPVQVFHPAAQAAPPSRARDHTQAVPVDQHLLENAERTRRSAESRAEAAEQNLRGIQKQLNDALESKRALEAHLVAAESTTHTSDSESAALRQQLGETTERLNRAEIDAKALRERLALRQQELEESQSKLASARASTDVVEELKGRLEASEARGGELEELRSRLESAESRAEEMAGEMARMEADLEYTAGQLHMSKLSEALRDIEHEAGGDEPDGPLERPVIIRGNGGPGGKVR